MATIEFFYAPDGVDNIDKAEINHIVNVKRYAVGDEIGLTNGKGRVEFAIITSVKPFGVEILRTEEKQQQFGVTLVLALLKGARFEQALEMAVELGVKKIILWQANRSIKKLDTKQLPKELAKINNLIISAAKQSRRVNFPFVEEVVTSKELTTKIKQTENAILLYEHALTPFADVDKTTNSLLIIGPEGGITAEEAQLFESAGAKTASLGETILRSPTAVAKAIVLCYNR